MSLASSKIHMDMKAISNKIKYCQILLTLHVLVEIASLGMNSMGMKMPIVKAFEHVSKVFSVGENTGMEELGGMAIEEENESESKEEALGYIDIKASWLNVRETPNGTIIGKVALGESYNYYEIKDKWLRIEYEGSRGYIFGDYGDIYDIEGNLLTPSNIPQKETIVQQADNNTVEQPAAEKQVQQKKPQDMTTGELCQWVLDQIITSEMDDFAKVRAVNQYLCDHITYDKNYYTTRDAILLGKGRCQGYTNAFKNLMNTLGIPTDYIRGYIAGETNTTHAWNRVLINGTYYYVDVTWNDSTGSNSYLLLGEAEFNQGRSIIEFNPRSE